MPYIQYKEKKISPDRLDLIELVNNILEDYERATLRQIYYRLIAGDHFPDSWADENGIKNRKQSYDKLGVLVNDARMCGLLDWSKLVDMTRNLQSLSHFDDPGNFLARVHTAFNRDLWANQEYRLEVWIEKDALITVIEPPCVNLDVPYFSCRGYTSQSEMWAAGQRLAGYLDHEHNPQPVKILHFGDHDPSGLDMTRDIHERLAGFLGKHVHDGACRFSVDRIALSMEQVEQYNPPPNPAKKTDGRYQKYVEATGQTDSWELDALDPSVLVSLIQDSVMEYQDGSQWDYDVAVEEEERGKLKSLSDKWSEIEEDL
jgi:hypothetical protein